MMVGLLISIVTVVTMLSAYRSMVATSVPATRSAQRDGQIASALLTAQIELQQAGFGVSDAGSDIQLSADRRSIYWRFYESLSDPAYQCSGLQIVASDVAPESNGIYVLEPKACASWPSAPAWNADERTAVASGAALFEPDESDEARTFDLSGAKFDLKTNISCGPYGTGGKSRSRVVLRDEGPSTHVTLFSLCLTNT